MSFAQLSTDIERRVAWWFYTTAGYADEVAPLKVWRTYGLWATAVRTQLGTAAPALPPNEDACAHGYDVHGRLLVTLLSTSFAGQHYHTFYEYATDAITSRRYSYGADRALLQTIRYTLAADGRIATAQAGQPGAYQLSERYHYSKDTANTPTSIDVLATDPKGVHTRMTVEPTYGADGALKSLSTRYENGYVEATFKATRLSTQRVADIAETGLVLGIIRAVVSRSADETANSLRVIGSAKGRAFAVPQLVLAKAEPNDGKGGESESSISSEQLAGHLDAATRRACIILARDSKGRVTAPLLEAVVRRLNDLPWTTGASGASIATALAEG